MSATSDFIACALGTLQAGGTYVPIDPRYPESRQNFIVEDSGVVLVIGHARPTVDASPIWARAVLADTLVSEGDQLDETPPSPRITVHHAAHIMYTSGSTGNPNGVCVTHEGLLRICTNTDAYDVHATDRTLFHSNVTFDASCIEIWPALLHGATIVVAPRRPSLGALRELIVKARVSFLQLTTALFHKMVEHHADAFEGVRIVVVGGEIMSGRAVSRLHEVAPRCRLVNAYGPTESTCISSAHVTSPEDGAGVPIGRAFVGTELYVLDGEMNPVTGDSSGELYVGGQGLARCYVGRPRLTAERFVPNPFCGEGARLYRTGDMVRWRADGALDFVGRIDNQIKIRGFRVEPEETLKALLRLPEVSEAAVHSQPSADGSMELVARATPRAGVAIKAAELRQQLAAVLPDYLMPGQIIVTDRLLLNANGKTARADAGAEVPRSIAARPTSGDVDLTNKVIDVWKEILKTDNVVEDSDFFELGGHSLLAMDIVVELDSFLGTEVPLELLLETPRLSAFVQAVESLVETRGG